MAAFRWSVQCLSVLGHNAHYPLYFNIHIRPQLPLEVHAPLGPSVCVPRHFLRDVIGPQPVEVHAYLKMSVCKRYHFLRDVILLPQPVAPLQ